MEGKTQFDIDTEANYFARELLMPLQVLDEIGARTHNEISVICDVSIEATKLREKDFIRRDWYKSRHGNTGYDKKFLVQYKTFIDKYNNEFSEELRFIA